MSDKYFYIAVPEGQFQEAKHAFYEAPSSYLKVYNGDHIRQLEVQITELQNLAEERGKALEFYADKENWELPSFGRGHSPVVSDRGQSARQALGKEESA
ncbi:hypothetical protein [Paenibacillus spongiae]|uniref:Uncharacterized protein n=1 Tax=Paenibacillus spongiae TaxID=2909671 RepID=A0ABY5SFZ0_9BACL|nr:hypothetical protein [Paenibacillus spongiae]UVI31183.1 hypothetical protein L1F29_04895 [Paenibacillus spongiae]